MKKINVKWIVCLLLVALSLAGISCSKEKAPAQPVLPPEHGKVIEEFRKGVEESKKVVIAKVNGADITMNDLINEMNQLAARYIKYGQQRSLEFDKKVKQAALDMLVFRELAVQEAVKQGMKVEPAAIDAVRKEIKANLGSEDNFRKYLENNGVTEASWSSQIEKDKLFQMITAREISQKVKKPDEKLVRNAFNKERDTYTSPEGLGVTDVYFPGSKNNNAAMNKAKEVLDLIKKHDGDLSMLSQDKSLIVRNGIVTAQEYPTIYKAAAVMKSGDLSTIITEDDGLHIVKFMQKEPSRKMSFEEARGTVEQKLMAPMFEKRKEEWANGLKKNARIEILLPEVEKKLKEEAQKQNK